MSKNTIFSREELVAKVLNLERQVEDLRKVVKGNPGSGVVRLSCPPYEILVLDQRVE